MPIDKSSTVLTILLALIFLQEGISGVKILSVLLIGGGTLLMIDKKDKETNVQKQSGGWMIYAVLSAIFASLTAILGKIGIAGIDSNLGTAIRTTVEDRERRTDFYLFIRTGNGGVMVVLLPGAARWSGKRSRSH